MHPNRHMYRKVNQMPRNVHTSAYGPGPQYPGLGQDQFTGYPSSGSLPTPYQNPLSNNTGGGLGGSLGKFSMNDIKNIIDRMGGVDGIMTSIGKAQKMIQTFQQMGPMLKLLMGSFGSKAASTTDTDNFDYEDYSRKGKRRRRRRRTGSRKKTGARNSRIRPRNRKRRRY